jgi:hypothetical protein
MKTTAGREVRPHIPGLDPAPVASVSATARGEPPVTTARPPKAPLSSAQERMWLLDQLERERGDSRYNGHTLLRITGPLQPRMLEGVLQTICRRHAILRTRFETIGSDPVQVVDDAFTPRLCRVDVRRLDADAHERAVTAAVARMAQVPFALNEAPPVRFRLIVCDRDDHVLWIGLHHLIADGWSLLIFARELAALYDCACRRAPSPLPDLPMQYAEYAIAERKALRGVDAERRRGYWRDIGRGWRPFDGRTDAPYRTGNGTSGAARDHAGRDISAAPLSAIERTVLSAGVVAALTRRAREGRATVFMAALAAWAIVLRRWTGAADLLISTDVARRESLALEAMIGLFVNQVLLRINVDAHATLREAIAQARAAFLGAWTHRDLPFEEIAGAIAAGSGAERALRVPFHLVFLAPPLAPLRVHDVTFAPMASDVWRARFDLALFLRETSDGGAAWAVYDAGLFTRPAIRTLLRHLVRVLEMIGDAPDSRISQVLAALHADGGDEERSHERLRHGAERARLKATRPRPLRPGEYGHE